MTKIKVFELIESGGQPGKYILGFHPDGFYCDSTTGSFALMPARILGISYANYCRLCRDTLKAEIIGKNCKYPVVYFMKNANVENFVNMLNGLATVIIAERRSKEEE